MGYESTVYNGRGRNIGYTPIPYSGFSPGVIPSFGGIGGTQRGGLTTNPRALNTMMPGLGNNTAFSGTSALSQAMKSVTPTPQPLGPVDSMLAKATNPMADITSMAQAKPEQINKAPDLNFNIGGTDPSTLLQTNIPTSTQTYKNITDGGLGYNNGSILPQSEFPNLGADGGTGTMPIPMPDATATIGQVVPPPSDKGWDLGSKDTWLGNGDSQGLLAGIAGIGGTLAQGYLAYNQVKTAKEQMRMQKQIYNQSQTSLKESTDQRNRKLMAGTAADLTPEQKRQYMRDNAYNVKNI